MFEKFAEFFPVGTLYFPVSPVDGVSLLPESRWGLLSCAPEAGAQPN